MYKKQGAADTTYDADPPTLPGTYTVRVAVPETDTYEAVSDTADFTISRATVSATVTVADVVYGDPNQMKPERPKKVWIEVDQSIYAGLTTRAVNSSLPLGNEFMKPFSEINVVYEDIPFCAEHKTEWQARYAEIRDKR